MSKPNNNLFFKVISILSFIGVCSLLYLHFTAPTEKVAFVNTGIILQNYKGMKDARTKFQEMEQKWSANIDTLMSEIESDIKGFEKEQVKMTKKEKELSIQLIDNKQKQLSQYQQAIRSKAKEEENKLTEGPINQINSFLEMYGKENDFKMLFGTTNGNIVYAEDDLNITAKVLMELNQEYENE